MAGSGNSVQSWMIFSKSAWSMCVFSRDRTLYGQNGHSALHRLVVSTETRRGARRDPLYAKY